jgi:NADH:ubiquinone reductase (H+-translocating)
MHRTRILILGGGFGGVYAALEMEKHLARRPDVEVTLITRDNFFLFTPMLHEVAAGDLELSTIVNPLRKLLRRVNTFVGTVEAIDLDARLVQVSHGFDGHTHDLAYDQLVLALGSSTNFFGLPGVERYALTVKSLADAVALRNRLITHLEEANFECAAGVRHPLMTFVVAGGGFAGVETLGGINDFARDALRFFPNLREDNLRMVLVTPDPLILPELGPKLGAYAQRKLAARGVEIITGVKVRGVEHELVTLSDGRTIQASTLVWTAGTCPNPLVASLPVQTRNGRIVVDEYLAVPGRPGVWALGDCALVPDRRTGGFHPPTAQHALREGRTVARNVAASVLGGTPRPFRFCHAWRRRCASPSTGPSTSASRRTSRARLPGRRRPAPACASRSRCPVGRSREPAHHDRPDVPGDDRLPRRLPGQESRPRRATPVRQAPGRLSRVHRLSPELRRDDPTRAADPRGRLALGHHSG